MSIINNYNSHKKQFLILKISQKIRFEMNNKTVIFNSFILKA